MRLYAFASDYSKFGYHRTGSSSQLAAEDWLFTGLQEAADKVRKFSFNYPHFEATSEIHLDGRLVSSMPLYYGAVGELKGCPKIETAIIDIGADEHAAYEKIQVLAKLAGINGHDALVVATRCLNDSLYAFNVTPILKNTLPVILIPGSEFEILSEQKLDLHYSAGIAQRSANNIIASFGTGSSIPPIVITTPMSGWFECAGERGTGLALALDLAKQVSVIRPVELVLTSAHELAYLGGFEYVRSVQKPPAAVIHLGSSLATYPSSIEAWSNVDTHAFEKLARHLSVIDIGINKVPNSGKRSDWVGEAECWAHFNSPMLSIAGSHDAFHTPEDKIDLVTNEHELLKMRDVLSVLADSFTTTI